MLALQPVVGSFEFFCTTPTTYERLIGLNHLECNGVAVSRSNYEGLFDAFDAMRVMRGSGSTTLSTAIDISQTSFSITSVPSGWPATPFLIDIDAERMLVTNRAGTTLTVVRAREATQAAAHVINSNVYVAADLPFGNGDGSTTFNIPDLHGRVPWSLSPYGGHVDVTQLGLNDGAALNSRRVRHRHTVGINGSFSVGNWGYGVGSTTIDDNQWGSPNFQITVGPQTYAPLDTPSYLVAGVWGIRFVG